LNTDLKNEKTNVPFEIDGCRYQFRNADNAGGEIDYCTGCLEGYAPGEWAGFTNTP